MRWDLIDKFEVLKKGRFSRAVKSFSGDEDFFSENFPGHPLVPETLLLEMIAQAGGVLFGLSLDFKKEVILAKISNASFGKPVPPPCRLSVEARLEEEREEGAWISGAVKAAGQTVAQAKMLLVTFESLERSFAGKVVFNEGFLNHFDIYNVAKMSEGKF
jgi:3-hydroxyacyl-[acyl-carrier-protein] dehydratase